MSESAGPGSPVYFACYRQRLLRDHRRHSVVRTGQTRPYSPPRYSALGVRSLRVAHEYRCSTCGYLGWTNHMDILRYREAHQP